MALFFNSKIKMKIEKEDIIQYCITLTNKRIEETQQAMSMANESIVNDTKSSMGDKYETSREMAQQQLNRLQTQMVNAENDLAVLKNLPIQKSDRIGLGSVVITDQYCYLIATSIGPINLDNQKIMIISKESPIGKLLLGKTKGDEITFNGNNFQISTII